MLWVTIRVLWVTMCVCACVHAHAHTPCFTSEKKKKKTAKSDSICTQNKLENEHMEVDISVSMIVPTYLQIAKVSFKSVFYALHVCYTDWSLAGRRNFYLLFNCCRARRTHS